MQNGPSKSKGQMEPQAHGPVFKYLFMSYGLESDDLDWILWLTISKLVRSEINCQICFWLGRKNEDWQIGPHLKLYQNLEETSISGFTLKLY